MKKKRQCYSGIGGQAVLEGVMMKSGSRYAVSVRREDGGIEVEIDEYHGFLEGSWVRKIPFVRGIFAFADSMVLGMRSLNVSTRYYEEEDKDPTKADRAMDRATSGNGEKLLMALTSVLAFALAIGLFMVLPYKLAELLSTYIRSELLMAVIEGLLRLVIFLIYITAITAMPDIRRLYRYHGAEHKCINCIESGKPLTVENAAAATRFHKRCGSSFMVLVLIISIILFFFIRVDSRVLRVLIRIALIPVLSGIAYEAIYWAGRTDNIFVRILSAPGILLQHLTTKEPDEAMLEVAIASVEAVFDWKKYLAENFAPEPEVALDEEGTKESAAAQTPDTP